MKKLAMGGLFLALMAPWCHAQTLTWVSDPAGSQVDFEISELLSKVHGHFSNIKATLEHDAVDVTRSSVQVTIDVGTVDTGDASRNAEMKGADYFDIAQFPTATFISTSVTKSGDQVSISGNLTLHGVTKPVVLKVQHSNGPVTNQQNQVHRTFSATTTINRTDFGIAPKMPSAMLGDDVDLTIQLDVIKQ